MDPENSAMMRTLARTAAQFLMAVVLLALSVCAVEVGLRWKRYQTTSQNLRSDYQPQMVVKPSETTFLDVAPLLDLQMPAGLSGQVTLRTNEFGLRGPSVSTPKAPGSFRVLCIGGSGLFGLGVSEEATVPGQLQALYLEHSLPHVEFLNAGCPGSGPLTNYLRLRQKLIALDPDLVIYCLHPRDVILDEEVRGALHLDELGMPAFASHPYFQGHSSSQVDRLCAEFATADWLLGQAAPMLGVTTSREQARSLSAMDVLNSFEHLDSILEIARLTSMTDCELMLSIVPENASGGEALDVDVQNIADRLAQSARDVLRENNFSAMNHVHQPSGMFQQTGGPALFEDPTGELTAAGNALFARTIAKAMIDFFPEILSPPVPGPVDGLRPVQPNGLLPIQPDARSTEMSPVELNRSADINGPRPFAQ